MITTSGSEFVIENSSQQKFLGSSIICSPQYYVLSGLFMVTLNILDTVSTNYIGTGYVTLTTAEVDAETGSGSGETAPWFNALEKAVVTKLSAYTGNSSTTFTIV
jgi:hypothetical protein